MIKNKPKVAISCLLVLITILTQINVHQVYALGMLRMDNNFDTEEYHFNVKEIRNSLIKKGLFLPDDVEQNSSIDLSADGYLPPIGRQDGGTCTAFATTYYQYSYMVNRKKGLKGEKAKIYSPNYVHSYLCGPYLDGIWYESAYDFLKERGGIYLTHFFYQHRPEVSLTGISKNLSCMRKALKTRIGHYFKYEETYPQNSVYSIDEKLYIPKLLLVNGYIPVTYYRMDIVSLMKNAEDQDVVYRMGSERGDRGGAHSVAIVGYDDNFECDVNRNGIIEEAERGAFKVANSWGDKYNSSGGFFWVLYDAIVNEVSQIPCQSQPMEVSFSKFITEENEKGEKCHYICDENGNRQQLTYKNWRELLKKNPFIRPDEHGIPMWGRIADVVNEEFGWSLDEQIVVQAKKLVYDYMEKNSVMPSNFEEIISTLEGKRTRMFSYGGTGEQSFNLYYFITVDEKSVAVVGQVDYQLNNRSDYSLTFQREGNDHIVSPMSRNNITDPVTATELFDLSELVDDNNSLLGTQNWEVTLSVGEENSSSQFDFSLIDNLGNIIPTTLISRSNSFYSTQKDLKQKKIKLSTNLKTADYNYDGSFTWEDLQSIFWHIFDQEECSVLQKRLMDFDNNGGVDRKDFDDILNYVEQSIQNGDTSFVKLTQDEFEKIIGLFVEEFRAVDNNYDGYLTQDDFDDLLYFLRSKEAKSPLQKKLFDCNKDGTVDSKDAELMFYTACQAIYSEDTSFVHMSKDDLYNTLADFGYTKLGDINMDGTVNETDFKLMRQMLSGTYGTAFQRVLADVNKDGQLTDADLLELSRTATYIDVNSDGRRNEDDIYAVRDHLAGACQLTQRQQKEMDFNGNGRVDAEDWYMLIYSYYLNMDTNPDLGRLQFYSDLFITLGMQPGDLNGSGSFDEYDLQFMKEALEGNAASYAYLFLADMNKDLKLDEEDLRIFKEKYMSDIPFTYTLDKAAGTMTITGVKDTNIRFADIQPTYCVNHVEYTVTAIGAKAFAGCHNLYTVYIPASVITIPGEKWTESPFYDTAPGGLKINCEVETKPSGFGKYWNNFIQTEFGYVMKDAGSLFEYEADHQNQTLTITSLKSDWYQNNRKSPYITVDDRYLVNGQAYTVRRIDDNAFCKIENAVESVELPAVLEEIGSGAFAGMYCLDTVSLARCVDLKKIGSSAFANNLELEQIWIHSSVDTIEADSPEESIVYGCSIDNIWIIAEASGPKSGWGTYWNYIDETTAAETNYIGANQSRTVLRSQMTMFTSFRKMRAVSRIISSE